MSANARSFVTLAASPQAHAHNSSDVSQVEYEMLLALLGSANLKRAVRASHSQHRPWNAPEASVLEPVTGLDPRD